MVTISSSDERIDSRDVIKQLDELKDDIELQWEEIGDLEERIKELREELEDAGPLRAAELGEQITKLEGEIRGCREEIESLEEEAKPLKELDDEGRSATGAGEWDSGVTLIAEGWPFRDYVKSWAEDVQGIDTNEWPFNCIDWEYAAERLEHDYATVEWEGQSFYVV